jgi:NTP pyrophosphatase (non-canonical NTP hydrolase)
MNQYDDIFLKAIHTWGGNAQEMMAIEECSELIKAICKFNRKPTTGKEFTDLIDEIADVTIMMRQMAIIVGPERVEERIKFKIERLKKRLNNTTPKEN